MTIDWDSITASDIRKACEEAVATGGKADRDKGLVIYAGERRLPAKGIVREAYRLANGLDPSAKIDFASGEATLNLLRRLGFRAERLSSRRGSSKS